MAKHNILGKRGEEMAVRHLRKIGCEILETNWRKGRGEVDIIAMDAGTLVFVEVKTRTGNTLAQPEHFVTPAKMKHLAIMAGLYLDETGYDGEIRFDVIGIWRDKQDLDTFRLRYFKDAFFPDWNQ